VTETFLDGRVTLHCGDVRAMLTTIPESSIDCVVTSPPYWGLRDYGVAGQIGLEPTLGEHLAVMVEVFAAVHRVLKPTGTLFLNYGDCYATSPNGRSAADTKAAGNDDRTFRDRPFSTIGPIYSHKHDIWPSGRRGGGQVPASGYLKSKDLCMVPNRLAIALQDWGWWVRSEIIWGKRNGMPDSSGKYRPSTAHEKIFMLTKSADCFYDAAAVAMPAGGNTHARVAQKIKVPGAWDLGPGGHGTINRSGRTSATYKGKAGIDPHLVRSNESFHAATSDVLETRYLRNYESAPLEVWPMATHAFSEAHFATFPPELAERAIKAGCPPDGHVLDPFSGSGTTAMVALALGRTATLIELNQEYCTLAQARIEAAFMGKDEGARYMAKSMGRVLSPGPLFDGAAE
jgi:DNA modification methylase